MIARIREWCRNESLGVVLPVGFILLWVWWQLLQAFAGSFLYIILIEVVGRNDFNQFGLKFDAFGVEFQPDTFVIHLIAAMLLAASLYALFLRPIPEDSEPERGMRECPECFSEIVADARRCAFCTSSVPPVIEEQQ